MLTKCKVLNIEAFFMTKLPIFSAIDYETRGGDAILVNLIETSLTIR